MAVDKSLYERMNPSRLEQASGLVFGYITAVDPKKRLCEVQTFGGYGSLNDQFIPGCQWLSLDSNPNGDEMTSIPRPKSYCVVAFIDGEPFIVNYFRGINGEMGAGLEGAYSGLEGDKIISTVGGNRIVVKRSGLIELHSKETLKRIYMPTDSRLIDICRNYELKADGGFHRWSVDATLNQTKMSSEYRANLARTQVVFDEIGNVDATTIFRRTMGSALPGIEGVSIPQFKHEIKTTGENILQVSPPGGIGGVTASIAPTGAISVATGLAPINQMKLDVAADGTTSVEVNKIAKLTLDKAGDIKAENKLGSISMSKTGDLEIKNKLGSITMTAAGTFTVKGKTAELLDLFSQHLDQQVKIISAIQKITVGTGTGPSSPPLNSGEFAAAIVSVNKIKSLLASIKG